MRKEKEHGKAGGGEGMSSRDPENLKIQCIPLGVRFLGFHVIFQTSSFQGASKSWQMLHNSWETLCGLPADEEMKSEGGQRRNMIREPSVEKPLPKAWGHSIMWDWKDTPSCRGLTDCCEVTADHVTITELLSCVPRVYDQNRVPKESAHLTAWRMVFQQGPYWHFRLANSLLQETVLLTAGHPASLESGL